MNIDISKSIKFARRLIITIIGFTILLLGLAMIVLPGPAFILIPVGIGILATEFMWARNLLNKVKKNSKEIKTKYFKKYRDYWKRE